MRRVTDEIFIANATRELSKASSYIAQATEYIQIIHLALENLQVKVKFKLDKKTPLSVNFAHIILLHRQIICNTQNSLAEISLKPQYPWQEMMCICKKNHSEIVETLNETIKINRNAITHIFSFREDFETSSPEARNVNVFATLEFNLQIHFELNKAKSGIDFLHDKITESLAHRLILQEENEEDSDSASDYQSDSASDFEESKHQSPALYTTFNPQDFPVYMAKCATREAASVALSASWEATREAASVALSASWEARRKYNRIGFSGISRAQKTAFAPGTPVVNIARQTN